MSQAGAASSSSGSVVSSVTAGANINLTGTASNPIINLDTQILEPNGTSGAPSYSFASATNTGMYLNGSSLRFAVAGNDTLTITGNQLNVGVLNSFFNGMDTFFQSGISFNPRTVSANYAPQSFDCYISVTTTSGAITISLPNTPSLGGQWFIVKDNAGDAATNHITVTTVGGVINIDGATTYVINTNYGFAQFVYNPTTLAYEVI